MQSLDAYLPRQPVQRRKKKKRKFFGGRREKKNQKNVRKYFNKSQERVEIQKHPIVQYTDAIYELHALWMH
jgi:hypothetical protein